MSNDQISNGHIKYNLLTPRPYYKPFQYPWSYEACLMQHRVHWLPEEVPLTDDVYDWKFKITDEERNLLTQIFRFFTQADINVNECYMQKYARVFKATEVNMMLSTFSAMETVHVLAYSHLLDTVGMPEVEYSAFMKYKQMKDKCEYVSQFDVDTKTNIAKTLAVFGAFTEGLQLFASFAMLLNFPRFNKMKGMGQIIKWSVRDESLHTLSIIKLFRTFIEENPEVYCKEFEDDLYNICKEMVTHEDAFIDLAFELGGVKGMTSEDIKKYIRYIADRRLIQLGLDPLYKVKKNPIPWLEEQLYGVEHTNFFENRVTEYSKGATKGTWDELDNPEAFK